MSPINKSNTETEASCVARQRLWTFKRSICSLVQSKIGLIIGCHPPIISTFVMEVRGNPGFFKKIMTAEKRNIIEILRNYYNIDSALHEQDSKWKRAIRDTKCVREADWIGNDNRKAVEEMRCRARVPMHIPPRKH
jgi:hypothetical protein